MGERRRRRRRREKRRRSPAATETAAMTGEGALGGGGGEGWIGAGEFLLIKWTLREFNLDLHHEPSESNQSINK
jgi:hypothetical protein